MNDDRVALVDMDGTIADYDKALIAWMNKLRGPGESEYTGRIPDDPYLEARRKLITMHSSFWENLEPIQRGFDIVEDLKTIGFSIHILTQGPRTNPEAWSGKVRWAERHMPNIPLTITRNKSLSYGRILFDDYPPYFTAWLKVRPRGLVVAVEHPWNRDVEHPNLVKYDGTYERRKAIFHRMEQAFNRKSGEL